MAHKKSKSSRSWIVRVTCTIVKDIICEPCTKEEAADRPWHFAIDQYHVEMVDWNVSDVRPNV